MESEVWVLIDKSLSLDWLNDPVTLEYIAPKVQLFVNIFTDGRYLICETLVEVTNESSMSLDEYLHVVSVPTWREEENHRCLSDDWLRLNEDWLCAHFLFIYNL